MRATVPDYRHGLAVTVLQPPHGVCMSRDKCTVVLQGRLHVVCGDEEFESDRGPWTVLGAPAMRRHDYRADVSARVVETSRLRPAKLTEQRRALGQVRDELLELHALLAAGGASRGAELLGGAAVARPARGGGQPRRLRARVRGAQGTSGGRHREAEARGEGERPVRRPRRAHRVRGLLRRHRAR